MCAGPQRCCWLQARGGELAWKSLHKHLLEPLDAHLALMFTETQQPTMLHELAQYSWTVPEYEDWGVVLDQAAAQCHPNPERIPWRELCSVPDQFLGGVGHGCRHRGSAGRAAILPPIKGDQIELCCCLLLPHHADQVSKPHLTASTQQAYNYTIYYHAHDLHHQQSYLGCCFSICMLLLHTKQSTSSCPLQSIQVRIRRKLQEEGQPWKSGQNNVACP